MKTLLVIFGGCSSEYEVSLRSAASVLRNIPKGKYTVLTLGITKDGRWLYFSGDTDSIENGSWINSGNTSPALVSPDREAKSLIIFDNDGAKSVKLDVIFPVLHGKNGEDGTIQGIFELAGIPYVGCSPLASGMCMDKAVTNTMCDVAKIAQAKWVAFTKDEYENGCADLDTAAEYLKYPIFVKPANAGSSVGISKAHNKDELVKAMTLAFLNDYKAVLEECVIGREIECAVMGNNEPVASCVGEVLPSAEFYDYDAKYSDCGTRLQIPAEIPESVSDKIRTEALRAYKVMGCSGLSRIDFFLKEDGTVCLNELNTLPGFTSISMFSKLFDAVGVSYSELIDTLITYALEKYNEK